MKKLKPYMLFDRHCGAQEGATLVFAFTSKEAKKIGWCGIITEICDGDYLSLTVNLIKTPWIYSEADQEKLKKGEPHVVEHPSSCDECHLWGNEMVSQKLCCPCQEMRDPIPAKEGE